MLDQLIQWDWQISHFLNGSSSLFADGVAMTATATLTWMPAAVVLLYVIIHNNEMKNIFLILLGIGLCILFADQIASGIFKPLVARFRPTNDPELMGWVDVVNNYRGGRYGFFSSHAANTFSVATFVALLVRNRTLSVCMVSWALLNCWTRVYLGVHYFGDVLVGTVCGILVGLIVYAGLFRFVVRREVAVVQSRYDVQTVTGYAVADARIMTFAVLLTYMFVCFRALWFG